MNISDLAGNVSEFILELYTSEGNIPCTLPGGNFRNDGIFNHVSYRNDETTYGNTENVGARATIF